MGCGKDCRQSGILRSTKIEETDEAKGEVVDYKGSLMLRLSTKSVDVDLEVWLENKKAVVEATLLSHYGLDSAQVVSFHREGRRLKDGTLGTALFHLNLRGSARGSLQKGSTPLAPALQRALEEASASTNVKVHEASARWSPVALESADKETTPQGSSCTFLYFVIGGLACCGAGFFWLCSHCWNRASTSTVTVTTVGQLAATEQQKVAPVDDAASTATPPSDDNNSVQSIPSSNPCHVAVAVHEAL